VRDRIISELKTASETLAVAKKILSRLSVEPMRVRDVWKRAVQDSAGVRQTVKVFYWLRDQGFIQKTGEDYCAPYELTEKGRQLYSALK
jgi:predicted methyltransferase